MNPSPCTWCGHPDHDDYEDGLIECRNRLHADVEQLREDASHDRAEIGRLREIIGRAHLACETGRCDACDLARHESRTTSDPPEKP